MNNKFDELARDLAQSVTRRGALKKFGAGLAGIALASLGLANKAQAGVGKSCFHECEHGCSKRWGKGTPEYIDCVSYCRYVLCADSGV